MEAKDLKISGSGTVGGGKFKDVKISGSGKIDGDIECEGLYISGSGKVFGNIKTEDIKISGSGKIDGNIMSSNVKVSGSAKFTSDVCCKCMKISGSSHIDGNLKGGDLKISGSTSIDKKVEGDKVNISGVCKIGNDCECEEFFCNGGFKIGGLLNSDNIEICLNNPSSVKEIGGDKITITLTRTPSVFTKIVKNIFGSNKGDLKVDTIEGNEIDIESTNAKIIRGNNVIIRKNCEVDLVEYKEKIEISPEAKVKEYKKIY